MPVHNAEIADIFERYALLLEIGGANPFRVRAYRNAARTVREQPHAIVAMLKEGVDLNDLPGIGEDLADKIREIAETGRLADLATIEKRVPPHLADLAAVPGLGPKRIKALYQKLGVKTMADLRRAAKGGRIARLPGFGPKTEAHILAEAERFQTAEKRTRLADAEEIATPLVAFLQAIEGVKKVTVAGSYRRCRDTVGDLDILVTCKAGTKVMDRFVHYDEVAEVLSKGKTRATVRLRTGMQVDVRVVPEASYGSALHYFTGSKEHNIAVRGIAVSKGLKLNEYGVFKGTRRIAGRTEADVYATVGLPYIEPELRENRGEIEAARKKSLPRLVSRDDIRGDLHVHTRASDGRNTIEEMAQAVKARGYGYLAICDHTRHVTIAHGLDEKRLARQLHEIDRTNEKMDGLRILKAAEVDILEDGSLDLPDRILKELDLAVCAVHYKFDLSEAKQTERIIRAMDNPYFSILAHPTGRLMDERKPYAVDMERLIAAARERGCFLEVNAQPERMDLDDLHCMMAKEAGVKLAVSTDAHSTGTLDHIRFGIDQARRGWLEPGDVLNTRPWPELSKLLRRDGR